MRIAIIGARAVGSVLGSLLWRAGEDVALVGRAAHVPAILAEGLNVAGSAGGFNAAPHAEERLSSAPDLALLTVKAQDVVPALRENAEQLRGAPILVLQNGLRAEQLAATVVPAEQLVNGVVSLHAQYLVPGHVVLMQSERLLIGPAGASASGSEPPRAWPAASQFSAQHVLDRRVLQRQVRVHPLAAPGRSRSAWIER